MDREIIPILGENELIGAQKGKEDPGFCLKLLCPFPALASYYGASTGELIGTYFCGPWYLLCCWK